MLTLEAGKAGLPVGDKLKLLKDTVAVKLNGFVMKLETALMNGKLEGEVFDGVKLGFEANALKVTSDGDHPSADLATIAVKLSGNVGHWLGAGSDVKLALEGQVQFALGGKLAAKLASQTAANVDRTIAAEKLAAATIVAGKQAETVKALEGRLATLRAPGATGAMEHEALEIERQLFEHRNQLAQGTKELKTLGDGLRAAENRAAKALGKIEEKIAKKIALAMEKKVVGKLLGFLMKAIPILNMISIAIDIADLIRFVVTLIEHGKPGAGDIDEGSESDEGAHDDKHGDGHGSGDAGDKPAHPPTDGGGRTDRLPDDGEVSELDPVAAVAARDALPSVARRIYNAVAHGGAKDPELDADQIRMIGLMIPKDLSAEEVDEVIGQLHAAGTKATAAEDVFAAIDTAVRDVRDRKCALSIDGVERPELAHPGGVEGPIAADGNPPIAGPITSPKQLPSHRGPVTSPSQLPVDKGDGAKAYDVTTIVRYAPADYIGHWFTVRDGNLVLSDVGNRWISEHHNALVIGMHLTTRVQITAKEPGNWNIGLRFELSDGPAELLLEHSFFVSQTPSSSGLGARVDGLTFEPFTVVNR